MSDTVTTQDLKDIDRVLSNPLLYPQEFKSWLTDQVTVGIPLIPFSQIFGARINIARQGAYIPTSESTSEGVYTDLATVGPQLTQLADGKYLVAYGCNCRSYASISINGSTPLDADAIFCRESFTSGSRQKMLTLKNNNQNTLKLQYKSIGDSFSHRWLVAIRVGPG